MTFFIVSVYDGDMEKLQQIADQQPELTLERFVETVNDCLPQFLPESTTGGRGQESVNARLVRHYTTQGLLDKPLKQGREARYVYRHVLQLLALRRLLADGYSVSSIAGLIDGQANPVLESILQGSTQLTVEAANPALAFLSQIRDRATPTTPAPAPAARQRRSAPVSPARTLSAPAPAVPAASPAEPPPQTWTRFELRDGLELHLRQDFVAPATPAERDQLLQLITHHLIHHPDQRPTP
ncbi:MAG: MerR family transcriptional regulator [Cyanobacteria bacterium J06607_6]